MKFRHYSMLNKIIRQMRSDGKYIIDRQDIAKYVDLSKEDQAEKDEMLANFMAGVMLHQNDYRSIVKGHGIFIDVDALRSKTIANTLKNNANLDVGHRTAVLQKLEMIAHNLPDEDCSQINFCQDDDGNLIMYEDMTKQELIELIRALQNNAMEKSS